MSSSVVHQYPSHELGRDGEEMTPILPLDVFLFDETQIAAVPMLVEHTAEELNALLGTMSFWSRLSPKQRAAVERDNRTLYERLGRPIRSSIVACAVTARRPHVVERAMHHGCVVAES